MDAKEFVEKSVEETQEILQKRLDDEKAKIKGITDLEELKAYELEIDKEQEEYDKYLREREYEIPQDPIIFSGKTYSVGDIATKITYHLNRIEQSFEYVMGLLGLVNIWKTRPIKKISFGAYDSTLRLLNQLKYRGAQEWTEILAINEFLKQVRDDYTKDLAIFQTLAEIRNIASQEIELRKPNPTGVQVEDNNEAAE